MGDCFSIDLAGFLLKLGDVGLTRTDTEAQHQSLVKKRASRSLTKAWSKREPLSPQTLREVQEAGGLKVNTPSAGLMWEEE